MTKKRSKNTSLGEFFTYTCTRPILTLVELDKNQPNQVDGMKLASLLLFYVSLIKWPRFNAFIQDYGWNLLCWKCRQNPWNDHWGLNTRGIELGVSLEIRLLFLPKQRKKQNSWTKKWQHEPWTSDESINQLGREATTWENVPCRLEWYYDAHYWLQL